MLDAVLASFVDSVTEREFDAPFLALLRALGFHDIHFLHGAFEFGKDFIAKRAEAGISRQYVFQSKAGDLGLSAWTAARGQVDTLRRNQLAHPGFDAAAPRQAVFLTTGRLVGGAALDAQDYCRDIKARGEVELEIWDRERLIELLRGAIHAGLAGRTEGPLLGIIASIDDQTVTDRQIELVSRRWYADGQPAWPCALEAAVVATRLAHSGRLDLACYVGLALIRAAWRQKHGTRPPVDVWSAAADIGVILFRAHAEALWERHEDESIFDAAQMIGVHDEPSALVTYAVRCVRLLEILGLFGLMERGDRPPSRQEVAAWIAEFISRQPGSAFPISDRWAVALVAPVLLLERSGRRAALLPYLQRVIKWVADRYGDGVGLAGPLATPDEEVRQLIGNVVPPRNASRRMESYVATIVLDLTAFLNLNGTYRLARNEFLAVEALPSVLTTNDSPGQYVLDSDDTSFEPNVPYADGRPADWLQTAPHYRRAVDRRYLQEVGRSWDHLAVSAVLRDRHFLSAWPDLVRPDTPPGQRSAD